MRPILLFIILLALSQYACKNQKSVDVSGVEVDFEAMDFYKDFAQFDTTDCAASVLDFDQRYPTFFNFYTDTLMEVGSTDSLDGELCERLSFLRNNKDLRFLTDTILTLYPNTTKQTSQLRDLFGHIKYYIPDWKVPDVIYFDGGLRLWSVVIYQDYVAIGLDMFLGKDFQYYASRQIPAYMADRFEPSQIPVQTGKALYQDLSKLDVQSAQDFLQMMIESGKEVLFLSYMLPDLEEHEYFSLSEDKYKWLVANEADIYNYFITHEMIYSTDLKNNLKYIQDAPYSPGMPAESPGKTGVYLGYKILQSYMQNTGAELMPTLTDADYMTIFEKSNYKPI